MIAYPIIFVTCLISSLVVFLPGEVVLLMLANVKNLPPIHAFGFIIDVSPYGTSFPWLLPVAATVGSNFGSMVHLYIGSGSLRLSGKLKKKLESFNFERFTRARDAIIFVSCITSIPPVSLTAIASGMSGMKLPRYYVITFAGKLIRYYLVLILGQFAFDFAARWLGFVKQ